ncbi:hypothetical protein FHR87_000956 [Azomonas macrocytogenes]|uniref:Uncharacterized protein n=1 Tax=Azomonas macrocytogenes TaxID=69962 RepID=A0A839T4D1_AZOMA|nr:hypothetical protein [Azomonas macrocytogenes]
MQDHRPVTLTLPDRHLHSSNYPLPILAVMHRPTDHQFAVQVEYHAQEQLALQSGNLRDVRNPFTLGFQSREVSFQQVIYARWTAGRHQNEYSEAIFTPYGLCAADIERSCTLKAPRYTQSLPQDTHKDLA